MKKIKLKTPVHFENIREIIYNSAKVYGEKAAYIIKHKNNEYENKSYTQLLEDINTFGAGLYSLGLAGKRVAVIGRNRYEWAVAHLANVMGDIVSVPLDKDLQVSELEDSLNRSGAEAVVYDEKLAAKIDAVKDKAQAKHFICMAEGYGMSFSDVMKLGRESGRIGEYTDCKIDADALSILLFTSGTTDKSKAVMLCQRGIAQNIYDMQLVEDIRSSDVNIAFLPFHHIFGSTGFLVMLACGVTTVFTDGLRYVKKNLKEYKVSLFIGVPVILDSMYKNIEKEIKKQGKEKLIRAAKALSGFLMKMGIDMRRVIFKAVIDQLGGAMRMIISGGAPLDKETARNFRELGIELVQGYGLTETSPVIAAESWEFMRTGSVGKPMASVDVRISDKDENGIGEIQVRGKNVMLGYYENEEATNDVIKDGWFSTGDLGYLDKDGYLFITGRRKDMIVLRNGKKVFPEEIETLINRTEGVKESFVYGIEEDGLGCEKVLCKIVYDSSEVSGTAEEIHTFFWNKIKEINKTLPMYKYIKGMILTDEPLIKTTTNKVKRKEELAKILSDN